MNNANSVLKKAVVTALFLICAIAFCRSQSISPNEYVRAVAVNTNEEVREQRSISTARLRLH